MISETYTEHCPSCGDGELIREDRITGGGGVRLPYTRWACARCRFTWYTPLVVAAPLEQLHSGATE